MKEKFLEEATTPLAKRVGNTISSIWTIVFGYIDIYAEKKEFQRQLHLQSFKDELERKVSSVPPEKLVEPPLHVLGPTLEASKYYFECEELRAMFANLIASSVNKDTTGKAHPSFVEVIKQINPDEAKILKLLSDEKSKAIIKIKAYNQENNHFAEPVQEFSMLPYIAGCEHVELGPSYLVNLARLGLANIEYGTYSTIPNSYEPIYEHPTIVEKIKLIEMLNKRVEIVKGTFTRTKFGEVFYTTCVQEK